MTPRPRTIHNLAFALLTLSLIIPAIRIAHAKGGDGPEELLEKALQKYREFETFQCKVGASWEHRTSDDDEEEYAVEEHESEATLVFKAPDQYRKDSEDFQVVANKDKLSVYSGHHEQYVETKPPADRDLSQIFEDMNYPGMQLGPIASALYRRDATLKEFASYVTKWKGVVHHQTNDVPYAVISGEMQIEQFPVDTPLPFTVTLRLDTWLIEEIVIDATEAYREMHVSAGWDDEDEDDDEPTTVEAFWKLRYYDFKINEDVSDDQFVFTPPEDSTKMDEFVHRGGDRSAQLKLIGKPAPAFEGEDIDGEKMALADYKGKIVLLDFWATWCGPCVKAMPAIQGISETYADKDVVVIGMNRDRDGSEKKVKRFLEKKEVTFRQFMDTEGEAAESYEVSGIPCSVLIDKKGVIQLIKTGYSPGSEDELTEAIDTLLAGKQVYDEEELKEQIAMAEEYGDDDWGEDDEEDDETAGTNTLIKSVAKERIVLDGKKTANIMRHNMREMDLDGDGKNEILSAGWQGTLYIVSSDGTEVEKVRFKGRGGRYGISSFAPVEKEDGRYWVVAFQKHSTGGKSNSRLEYYNPEGERLWSYEPELGKDMNTEIHIEVADLDGDGTEEGVLVMTVHKLRKMKENSWRHVNPRVYLGVFDLEGNILSMKKIGQHYGFLRVVQAEESDAATILVGVDNKLRRYHYDPEAKPEAGAEQ